LPTFIVKDGSRLFLTNSQSRCRAAEFVVLRRGLFLCPRRRRSTRPPRGAASKRSGEGREIESWEARRDIGAHIERRAHRRCAVRRMVDHRYGPRHLCPITLFFPGNAAVRILEHETTFHLAMVTAPMRRLSILLLFCAMSIGYEGFATAARCQSPSGTMRT